ncbi:MAG: hypothetical protein IPK16_23615 [Anaerolineales bacterium]|nr:hypothetical protein [Anaerolineales bacterium]
MLGDLLQVQRPRAVVLDGLPQLVADRTALSRLNEMLGKLVQLARSTGCALVFLDDPKPPWQRWFNLDGSRTVRWRAALHIELQRERWLRRDNEMTGYHAQARLLKSRWVHALRSAEVEIVFNGTVRARETW